MRHIFVFAFLIIVCSLRVAAQQSSSSIVGDWTGGIDSGKWQPIDLHFVAGGDGLSGTVDFPSLNRRGLQLTKVSLENSTLRLEWQDRNGVAALEGAANNDFIDGQYTYAGQTAPFKVVRVAKSDPQLNEEYAGSYQLGPQRFVDIGPIDNSLLFIDSQTRDIRLLYPSSATSFFAGSSVAIPFPREVRIDFIKDENGRVSGLKWQEEKASPAITAKKLPLTTQEVSYQNGDATITATLLLPTTKGPFPALIDVGQGYFLGPYNGPFQYFYARQGLAVMTPIRRMVGGAESNYLKASFEERAREVVAGVDVLKKRRDINPQTIGLYGDSQTAWIAPLAASVSPDVAWLILRVPSALPVTENILFEIESNLRRDKFPGGDIARALALRQLIHRTILSNQGWIELKAEIDKSRTEKWFPLVRAGWFSSLKIPPDENEAKGLRDPLTYDPLPILESIKIPVLAMNGELDEAVPTSRSVPILEQALRTAGNKDFTVRVFPGAGHNFLETSKPYGAEEFARKKKYVVGYWDTVADWLRKHVGRAGP